MNKQILKKSAILLALVIVLSSAFILTNVKATSDTTDKGTNVEVTEGAAKDNGIGSKAIGASVGVGLGALGAALGMGFAIAKAVDGISRQPEAEGQIRTTLMLGLVFIETVVIYALIVAILVIFVL